MKTIMQVYRDMLKQATIFEQKSNQATNGRYKDYYRDLADELYCWLADLEETKEVNENIKS